MAVTHSTQTAESSSCIVSSQLQVHMFIISCHIYHHVVYPNI